VDEIQRNHSVPNLQPRHLHHLDLAISSDSITPSPAPLSAANTQATEMRMPNSSPSSSDPIQRLEALYPRAPLEPPTQHEGQSTHRKIFSGRVQRLISCAIDNGEDTVDLRDRVVPLAHLDRYYAALNTSDTQSGESSNRGPGLILSQARLYDQLLLADPTLSQRYANRLIHLLATPLEQGGVRLVQSSEEFKHSDTSRAPSAPFREAVETQNRQIEWANTLLEARGNLDGLWQLLDQYRIRFEPHTKRGTFILKELKPFIELHTTHIQNDSVISDLRHLNQFISNLLETREYQNTDTRNLLLARCMTILRQMLSDETLFHDIIMLASNNLEDCVDRRANTLLDMELRCELHQYCQKDHGTQTLYEQGLKFLRLEVAEHFAWQHCMQSLRASHASHVSRNADESVEVMLYIRIKLRDMGLPLTGSTMNYATSINLSESTLARIRDKITSETSDINRVKTFFRTFDPWLQHLKKTEPTAARTHLDKAYAALDALEQKRCEGKINENEYVQQLNLLKNERENADAEALRSLSDHTVEAIFDGTFDTTQANAKQA
jgi:hypothetical protein